MELTCKALINGIMAYWSEAEEAVRYNITLYINNQPISKRSNERSELYCTFTGLAAIDGITQSKLTIVARAAGPHYVGMDYSSDPKHSGFDYYVQVEAEDRSGNIIETSEKVKCAVREF